MTDHGKQTNRSFFFALAGMVVAVATSGASGIAFSQTYNVSEGGGFTDLYPFHVSDTAMISVNSVTNHPFSNASVALFSGTPAAPGAEVGTPLGLPDNGSFNVPAGDYFYRVAGTFPNMGGSYSYFVDTTIDTMGATTLGASQHNIISIWAEHDSFEFDSQTASTMDGGSVMAFVPFHVSGTPSAELTATAVSNHPFGNATVELFSGTPTSPGVVVDSFQYAGSLTFPTVAPGDYFYKLSGTFPNMGGSYSYYLASTVVTSDDPPDFVPGGQVSAEGIPEPITAGLGVMGLGALVYTTKRRHHA